MSRMHLEVKIMRAPFTGTWYAVRERAGVVTDKWPIDVDSSRQLDEMRAAHATTVSERESSGTP